MKTIIAPLYQHDIISKNLLQNNEILLNTTIIPLHAYIDTLIDIKDDGYDLQIENKLNSLKPSLKILDTYLNNELFLKSLKEFHVAMYLYNINVEDLPKDSNKDHDLYLIFKSIYSIIPHEIKKLEALEAYLQVNPIENTELSKFKVQSDYEKVVLKLLKSYGLKELDDKHYKASNVSVYYANNIRSEVEASAQLIIEKDLYNAQVILLDSSYEEIVKQVYKRYNISNNLNLVDSNNTYIIKVLSVFKLLCQKDNKSVTDFLSSNPFNLENAKSISLLHDFFNFNLERLLAYEPKKLDDPIIHEKSLQYYNDLVEESEVSFIELISIINSFDTRSSLSLCESIFNYFQEFHYSHQLVSIQNTLLKNQEILKNSENLYDTLENLLLKSRSSLINSDYIVVTSLDKHEYFNKKDVIILGSTIKNYPNLTSLSGVIDETYVSKLSYPSKTERFQEQLEYLESVKEANHLYIFYPLSNYDGKSIEPSFALLNYAKEFGATPKRYPLIENDFFKMKTYKLDPTLAQQLFFENGKLNRSLSALEQYNSCPYSYYLKYGLNIYPQSLPSLSYAYIGSVTHLIIEKIVQKSIDNHKKLSEEEAVSIIEDNFKTLELLNNPQVEIVKLTLIKHFLKVLKHMDEIDSDTLFKPILLERKFTYTINENMSVYGIIDRVDQYNDYVRVIDYKSSKHTLSESKLKQGLQLQLLTYLLAISSELKLEPAGAFYMSLKLENTATSYASMKLSSPYLLETLESDINEAFLKENRIEGWHFKEGDLFYKSSDYVSGLSSKDDEIKTRRIYNIDTVSAVIDKIYGDIYDNLSNGIIDCSPVDNPCQFCEYHSVCLSNVSDSVKQQVYKDQKLHEELKRDVD